MEYEIKFKKRRIVIYITGATVLSLAALIVAIISKTFYVLIGAGVFITYTAVEVFKEIKYRKLSYLKYDENKIKGYSYVSNTTIDCDISDVDIAVVANVIVIEIKNGISFVLGQVVDTKEHCARIKEYSLKAKKY